MLIELVADNLSDVSYIFRGSDSNSDSEHSFIRGQNKIVNPLSDYRKIIVLMMTIMIFKIWDIFKYCVKKLIIFLPKPSEV